MGDEGQAHDGRALRIAHCADIHVRGLSRHDEHAAALAAQRAELVSRGVRGLVIAGDTFHSKVTGHTPEFVAFLSKQLRELSSAVSWILIVLGNHDAIRNPDRLDAISPIVDALALPNVRCCRFTETVTDLEPGIAFHVRAPFDSGPIAKPLPGLINVAVYHGPVVGSLTDSGWDVGAHGRSLSEFVGHDCVMLGDIHKRQVFPDAAGQPWAAYPGSLIQQDHGETREKGFLVWTLQPDQRSVEFVQLPNIKPHVTLSSSSELAMAPPGARVRITSGGDLTPAAIAAAADACSITFVDSKSLRSAARSSSSSKGLTLVEVAEVAGYAFRDRDSVAAEVRASGLDAGADSVSRWTVRRLDFSNVFGYGPGNTLDFEAGGIFGLFGPNGAGKSSVVGALRYALFNDSDREASPSEVINAAADSCSARAYVRVDGRDIVVERTSTRSRAKQSSASTRVDVWELDGDRVVDMTAEQRSVTDAALRARLGSSSDFARTACSSQSELDAFVTARSSERIQCLARCLGLDHVEALGKHFANVAADAERELRSLPNGDVARAEARARELAGVAAERETELCQLEERRDALRVSAVRPDLVDERQRLSREARIARSRAAQIEAAIDESLAASCEALEEELSRSLEGERAAASTQALEAMERDARRRLAVLETVPCSGSFPTCQFVREALAAQRTLPDLAAQLAAAPKLSFRPVSLVTKLMKNARVERDKLAARAAAIASEGAALERACSAEARIAKIDELLAEADAARAEYARADSQVQVARLECARAAARAEAASAEREHLVETAPARAAAERRFADATTAARAFSKKGVLARLLEEAAADVVASANEALSAVGIEAAARCNGDELALEFRTRARSAWRDATLACGAERFFLGVAFRAAMLAASRRGADFLVIDEGFGALDPSNLQQAADLLRSLREQFSFVLLITHVDAIQDIVDETIEVWIDSAGRAQLR